MNARQKAKKYKKLYYRLYNSNINFTVTPVRYHTVRVNRSVPKEVALPCIEDNNYIKECISRDMAKEIMPYVRVNMEYEPRSCCYIFAGTLRIIEN